MDDEISVKELLRKISEDLLESEEERLSKGQRSVFEVSELTIELAFVVSRSREGRGGVDLRVVNIGGDASRKSEQTQRMTLKLVAADPSKVRGSTDDADRVDYEVDLPVRPRLRGHNRFSGDPLDPQK